MTYTPFETACFLVIIHNIRYYLFKLLFAIESETVATKSKSNTKLCKQNNPYYNYIIPTVCLM